MLNFYHLNYPSCKIPFLSSHTFHIPLSLPLSLSISPMHCSSISVQPGLLSYHAQGLTEAWLQPKLLNRGTTWQTGTAVCSAVFFQAFVHRVIRERETGSRGSALLLCPRGRYLKVCFTGMRRAEPNRSLQIQEPGGPQDGEWRKRDTYGDWGGNV